MAAKLTRRLTVKSPDTEAFKGSELALAESTEKSLSRTTKINYRTEILNQAMVNQRRIIDRSIRNHLLFGCI